MSSRANVPLPSGYTIRPYRDEDYHDARKIVCEGMGSLYWMGMKTSIRSIRILLILIISFAVPCLAFSSFKAGALSVSSLLLITSWSAWKTYNSHLSNVLAKDMSNIRSSYVSPRGAWFWVAEVDGRIVYCLLAFGRHVRCCLPKPGTTQVQSKWQLDLTSLKQHSVFQVFKALGSVTYSGWTMNSFVAKS
uniref:Uncharacterized protein n=1 Tax=Eptatretus burgeri TaxID=7764 RepID=A0A8C4QW61_EPTBU